MKAKIIVDSCVDFNDAVFTKEDNLERIPFKITIDEETFEDTNLDTEMLTDKMIATKNRIQTGCPSPFEYLQAYESSEGLNYVVTISANLSGSYSSACIAQELYGKEGEVHVFDSKSASAGESLIALKLKNLIEEGLNPAEIVKKTNEYISNLTTLFILDSMDNLVKNGRISNVKALVGKVLNIVPIMGENGNGEIILKEKVRGTKNAFARLVEMVGEAAIDFKETTLAITHANALEKAKQLKEDLMNKYNFKAIHIFEASGLSTVYMDNGGIVLAF